VFTIDHLSYFNGLSLLIELPLFMMNNNLYCLSYPQLKSLFTNPSLSLTVVYIIINVKVPFLMVLTFTHIILLWYRHRMTSQTPHWQYVIPLARYQGHYELIPFLDRQIIYMNLLLPLWTSFFRLLGLHASVYSLIMIYYCQIFMVWTHFYIFKFSSCLPNVQSPITSSKPSL